MPGSVVALADLEGWGVAIMVGGGLVKVASGSVVEPAAA